MPSSEHGTVSSELESVCMEERSRCSSRSAQGASPSPAAKPCTAQARIWVVFSPAAGARRGMRESSSIRLCWQVYPVPDCGLSYCGFPLPL